MSISFHSTPHTCTCSISVGHICHHTQITVSNNLHPVAFLSTIVELISHAPDVVVSSPFETFTKNVKNNLLIVNNQWLPLIPTTCWVHMFVTHICMLLSRAVADYR